MVQICGVSLLILPPKVAKLWGSLYLQMRKSCLSLWCFSPHHWHQTALSLTPVRYWWTRSVLSLSHNQREILPSLFGYSPFNTVSGEGVIWPPEILWCSKSSQPDGEHLKGVGGGVPMTLTNWHHVCSWRVGTQVLQKFLLNWQWKQSLTPHRNRVTVI